MGNTYCNFTTYGPTREAVIGVLNANRRVAFVAPDLNSHVVVFERSSDRLSEQDMQTVGSTLSRDLSCAVLGAAVYDDDEMWLCLFERGECVTEYYSKSQQASARRLCRAFGRSLRTPAVWLALRVPFVLYESFRHAVLAWLLGVPQWSVATGYRYLSKEEYPPGLSSERLTETGRGT
ncbi:MAG: hypothetical protein ACTHM6_01815 [Tepidisphaeraceae bacterium]